MRVQIRIFGQVQGVFFRSHAKEVADRLGLVGWVRNNSDGSVKVLAEGPKGKLEKFIKWCQVGPSGAQVEKVDVDWYQRSGEFSDFEILR